MPRYQVVAGRHNEPIRDKPRREGEIGKPTSVRSYGPGEPEGDIIETDEDMIKRFPGKFRLLPDESDVPEVTDARRVAVTELIRTGAYQEGDRVFLERLPGDGFNRILARERRRLEEQRQNDEAPSQDEGKSAIGSVKSRFGTNVTDQFQVAYDEGFLVFVNGAGKHQVTKRDAPTKALNKEALPKEGVEPFIKDWLQEFSK